MTQKNKLVSYLYTKNDMEIENEKVKEKGIEENGMFYFASSTPWKAYLPLR